MKVCGMLRRPRTDDCTKKYGEKWQKYQKIPKKFQFWYGRKPSIYAGFGHFCTIVPFFLLKTF